MRTDARVESPPLRSRIQGPRRVQAEMRRLLIKTHRCVMGRVLTDDEAKWCHRVTEFLGRLIEEGDHVISAFPDPRETRRVRKRPGCLF